MGKTKATHIYIDTSVFLAILLGEAESSRLLKLLGKRKICTSSLLILESERTLIRLSRHGFIEEKSYFLAKKAIEIESKKLIVRDFTLDLCLKTEFPAVKTPRSLDLAHLRTALWFKKNLNLREFVSLDEHQAACALELGLEIPG